MTTPDFIDAHPRSIRHRVEILISEVCGCFYCAKLFPPQAIHEWIDEPDGLEQTAICPHCGIDSVIGSASGYPITNEFLAKMNTHWF